jgi:hypothetical protein
MAHATVAFARAPKTEKKQVCQPKANSKAIEMNLDAQTSSEPCFEDIVGRSPACNKVCTR